MTIEIEDVPIENGGSFHSYLCGSLPEGADSFDEGCSQNSAPRLGPQILSILHSP